jgi:hypothetical protein
MKQYIHAKLNPSLFCQEQHSKQQSFPANIGGGNYNVLHLQHIYEEDN